MNFYLDENLAEDHLIKKLAKGGHSAIRPADVGMGGKSDPNHLEFAIRQDWIVLTRDKGDFEDLHNLVLASGGSHPGILVVRYEKDSRKEMKPNQVFAAIRKLEKSGVSYAGCFIVLNHWR
jgi:predicted nuclease of predicted toxin-antitoxin system